MTFPEAGGSKDGPRGSQDAPKTAQEGPESARERSETAKMPPRRPKTTQILAQELKLAQELYPLKFPIAPVPP
eukprot:9255281-Pyramimonas_sp.AAC.1